MYQLNYIQCHLLLVGIRFTEDQKKSATSNIYVWKGDVV